MKIEDRLKEALKYQSIHEINQLFNEIYLGYFKLIYFIIAKYVSTKEDVEELVDNVFINFYNKIKTTPIDNVKYYLIVSAKNISLNFLKKNKIKYVEFDDNFIYEKTEKPNNDKYYEIICDMQNVLSDFEIEIILKHVIFAYTFDDLSKLYNKPLKTIYSIYSRSIQKYKKYKEEEEWNTKMI